MITIIHGADTASSRNYLHEIKKNITETFSFDGNTLLLSDLIQLIEGSSLFSETKHICIENLFTKGKDIDALFSYLAKHEKDLSIYLWEGKDLTTTQLNKLKNTIVKHFTYPKTLFAFLDSLTPKNPKTFSLLKDTLISTEIELVFFMMVRHFRSLLALSERGHETIDEVARMAPWQKGKLEKQQSTFSSSKLCELYQKLAVIDKATKTGSSPLSLAQHLDFFLLEL